MRTAEDIRNAQDHIRLTEMSKGFKWCEEHEDLITKAIEKALDKGETEACVWVRDKALKLNYIEEIMEGIEQYLNKYGYAIVQYDTNGFEGILRWFIFSWRKGKK